MSGWPLPSEDALAQSVRAVTEIVERQRAAAKTDLLMLLDQHQSRSGRPISSLLADWPAGLLADVHRILLRYGLLSAALFASCHCAACQATRGWNDGYGDG